jgi:FlaA1/EpsC-like NDP-sugar epimerase
MFSVQQLAQNLQIMSHRTGIQIPRLFAINLIHAAVFALSGYFAFLLRFDFDIPRRQMGNLLIALTVWVPLKVLTFHLTRVDRGTWRFSSLLDFRKMSYVGCLASFLSALIIIFVTPGRFPRSLYFIDLAVSLLLVGGGRVFVRSVFEPRRRPPVGSERVFIYGAGAAGAMLLREIRHNTNLKYQVCGFIDDSPSKRGVTIHGVAVLGRGDDICALAAKHRVALALIAIPSASGKQMVKILDSCTTAKLNFRTMPSLSEMVNASARPTLRNVAVEDLLGRHPVRIDQEKVAGQLEGQVVLVTGAAGSIGAELCRQIARFRPKILIGFDAAETPLFHLEQEMRRCFRDVAFQASIGNMQNSERLREVFAKDIPRVVFHAAAYKHVPLMEANLFEAIENNVIGTHNLVLAASRIPGCDLIMISSDKAVRPTSVMGLTKRVAEIIVSSISNRTAKFVSVRFGNVLASNGSVVPIFRDQIAAGRALTVTHPEMRRYFMTIHEAVQLVLQAYAMGQGREIFVLDMGQQIKIVDLARSLILLSGLRPDKDIKIEFTGVRPGEKLYEEISASGEETRPTYHEKIRIFSGNCCIPQLDEWISRIRIMCADRDPRLILSLKEIVADYNPSSSVLQELLKENQRLPAVAGDERVRKLAMAAGRV